MYTSLCLVTVNYFTSGSLDKNGKQPIILTVIAGKAPNRTVLSGTVAETAGFEPGKSYLASCRETDPDPTYGRQFRWTKVSEASVLDVIAGVSSLGNAQVFDVNAHIEAPASVEAAAQAELAGK